MNIVSSNTPQSGLGQLDVVTGIFSFASGLFSKDPQKVEYDRIRQQVWDSIVQLVTEHDNLKASGSLSRSVLQQLIDTMNELMLGFKKYTDGMLSKYPGDVDWINPRFHDYYDFGMNVKNAWQTELATLPADYVGGVVDYIQDLFGGDTGSDITLPQFPNSPTMQPYGTQATDPTGSNKAMMNGLLVGGVLLGLLLMSKRKRG